MKSSSLVILSLLILWSFCQAPTWTTSSLVQAEKFKIVSTRTKESSLNGILTFTNAYSSIPYFAYGICNMESYNQMDQLELQILQSGLTSTSFSYILNIITDCELVNFEIRYISVSKSYPYHLNTFVHVPANFAKGALTNITTMSSTNLIYQNTINYTEQATSIGSNFKYFSQPLTNYKIALFTTTFRYFSDSSSPINLYIMATPMTNTTYKLYVQLGVQSKITHLSFSMVIFDQVASTLGGNYSFVYSRIQFGQFGGFYYFPAESLKNFMIGWTQFSSPNKGCVIQFKILYSNSSSGHRLQMPLSDPRELKTPISRFNFTILIMKAWSCPTDTILNPNTNLCVPCPLIGCINCLTYSICSLCNQSQGYSLNLATGQCQQISCYITGCINCSNPTTCTNCNQTSNYILLSNQTCQLCSQNLNYFAVTTTNPQSCVLCSLSQCIICSSLTQCSQCNTTNNYFLHSSGVCEFCNPLDKKFINSSNLECQLCTITNCQTCSSLVACSVCQGGFVVNSDTQQCEVCTLIGCQSCLTPTTCSECDTPNNYVMQPNNNTCIQCSPGTFANSDKNGCDQCTLASCLSCLTLTTCSSCNTSSSYYLNAGTCSYCDPTANNFINPTTLQCQLCTISNCASCSSLSSCSMCTNNHVLNLVNLLCQTCNLVGCSQCSTTITCSQCDTAGNYVLQPNNTCIQCSPGTFANSDTNGCDSCSLANCLSCLTLTTCSSCNTSSSYYLNAGICSFCDPTMNYFIDLTTLQCQLCTISNCASCSSLNSCSVCTNNHLLNYTDNLCYPCPLTDCQVCDNFTSCSSCQTGFVLNQNTLLCQVCTLVGCSNCFTSTVCVECDVISNYLLLPNSTCTLCAPGTFANTLTENCDLCTLSNCLVCSTLTSCSSCDTNRFYYLDEGTCLYCNSSMNYFINLTTLQCQLCAISNCIICSSLSTCLSCSNNLLLSSADNQCYSCNLANCLTCSTLTSCSSCLPGFALNSTTGLCQPCTPVTCPSCSPANCVSCPQSISICESCSEGYRPINGVCVEICGDFRKVGQQQCDDGNSQDKDGCSSSCTVETNFTCEPHASNPLGSACFYLAEINLNVVYIEKVNSQNKIEVSLEFFPKDLAFWDSVDFASMVQVQSKIPISGVTVTRNDNGTAMVTFEYSQDIHGQTISIDVNPASSGVPSLMRATPSSKSLVVDPTDNESAYFYDPSVYQMANSISVLCTAISVISLLFFMFGLISGKMIGVEMMAVIQISYFSLMSLTEMNPCFAALSSLRFVNGYNSLGTNHLSDVFSPNQVKGILLFSAFTENFNFTTVIIILPLIISLISLIVWKSIFKDSQKTEAVFKRSLGQYTLNGLIFSGYIIAVSFAMQIMYGLKNSEGLIAKISLPESVILLIMMIGYFIFLILKPEFFGEFTKSFNTDKLSPKFYCFMLVERLLVGVILVLMLSVNVEVVVPIVVFVLIAVFVIIKRPYKQRHHNFRVVANMVVASLVLMIYLIYRLCNNKESKNKSIFLYLPIIVCVLLIVCVIYNAVAIVYKFYRWIQKRRSNKYLQDELQQIKKLQRGSIYQNGLDSPSKLSRISMQPQAMKQKFMNTSRTVAQIDFQAIKNQIRGKKPNNNLSIDIPESIFNQNQLHYDKFYPQYEGL